MRREITGFRRDAEGDWVAELACLHGQHVRHQPPFWERPWVLTEAGRDARLGTDLDCPLCDRAELPADLVVVRTAGPFDESTLPAGLRRDHLVAERTWGQLRVLGGSVRFVMDTDPPVDVQLGVGEHHAIPPGVAHHLVVEGPVTVVVDFLVHTG